MTSPTPPAYVLFLTSTILINFTLPFFMFSGGHGVATISLLISFGIERLISGSMAPPAIASIFVLGSYIAWIILSVRYRMIGSILSGIGVSLVLIAVIIFYSDDKVVFLFMLPLLILLSSIAFHLLNDHRMLFAKKPDRNLMP